MALFKENIVLLKYNNNNNDNMNKDINRTKTEPNKNQNNKKYKINEINKIKEEHKEIFRNFRY